MGTSRYNGSASSSQVEALPYHTSGRAVGLRATGWSLVSGQPPRHPVPCFWQELPPGGPMFLAGDTGRAGLTSTADLGEAWPGVVRRRDGGCCATAPGARSAPAVAQRP